MTEARIILSDGNCGIAACRNVVLVDLRGRLEVEHVQAMGAAYTEFLKTHDKVIALVVARRGVPIATREARDEGAEIARRFGAAMAHVAIVFEDLGVVGQLMRTVVRGFTIISRSTPIVVYDDVESALRGIHGVLGAGGSHVQQELLQAFKRLRGQATAA